MTEIPKLEPENCGIKGSLNVISSDSQCKNGFKGTVVNRALPYLHGGSLEVTRTVALMSFLLFRLI